jgi:hypothetical protein
MFFKGINNNISLVIHKVQNYRSLERGSIMKSDACATD